MTGNTSFRVSADIGGTFTDVVVQNEDTGQIITRKIPSTPDTPENAVLQGLEEVVQSGEVEQFIHGTTIGLNAVLQRRGARTALVTTHGFQDNYIIQGSDRRDIYALDYQKPKGLIPPRDIFSVRERTDVNGDILTPLHLGDLDEVIHACKQQKYEAIAISFLFSFKNPTHERRARDYLAAQLPDVAISLSSDVSPEWREFARTSTTVLNAYTAPPVKRYLKTLVGKIDKIAPSASVWVMSSNGGGMSAQTAAEKPIRTLLSGPVGGGIGGEAVARMLDRRNLICVDMGGTSFDVSLVVDGNVTHSAAAEIGGLPIQAQMVDIHVIGAGGGSIARVSDGALRVGPQSAGARPGPVCYGHGGMEPTVTDANVVLGRINPDYFSGGSFAIDKAAADRAVQTLASNLGIGLENMAESIVAVADAKMADAIRSITVARGIDPRRFSLVVYGGAGALHGASIARALQIREVIIPQFPGVFSAWGMLQSDIRHDFKASFFCRWSDVDPMALTASFQALQAEAETLITAEGLDPALVSFQRSVDLRYVGQDYAHTCTIEEGDIAPAGIAQTFHTTYKERYGHSNPTAPIEVTTLRLRSTCRVDKPPSLSAADPDLNRRYSRPVYTAAGAWVSTDHISRGLLSCTDAMAGPLIIEEPTTTTFVPEDWAAKIHDSGHLFLRPTAERT